MSSKAREALEKIRSCADYIYSYPNNIGGVQQCARDIMETIDEIVREMRDLARLDKESADMIPRKHMSLALSEYSNRTETAYKREREATCQESRQVGDAAKYKEALSQIAYIVGMFDDIDNVRRRVKMVLENLKKQMPYESEVSNETTEA